LSNVWFSPMMTTTCLIGVVVNGEAITLAVVTWLLVVAACGDAVAAAAVSALATSPTAAAALTCLISFSFIGLPSPSVRELSGCRETAEGYLKASLSMSALVVHGRNKR
jgi:hypothetical protein